jgi:hypothetical protein
MRGRAKCISAFFVRYRTDGMVYIILQEERPGMKPFSEQKFSGGRKGIEIEDIL